MKKLVSLAALVMMLTACTTGGSLPASTIAASTLAAAQPPTDYLLGPGDKLQISVYGETSLSGEQLVGADGTVALPLAGKVPALGKTTEQVAAEIHSRLSKGYINNPAITVTVKNYRPFYILGEVNRPGQYEYSVGMSVRDAIAMAQGYTYRARKNEITLRREGNSKDVRVLLDDDMPIRPGDTIHIDERHF